MTENVGWFPSGSKYCRGTVMLWLGTSYLA